jgi:hypothetical protein
MILKSFHSHECSSYRSICFYCIQLIFNYLHVLSPLIFCLL